MKRSILTTLLAITVTIASVSAEGPAMVYAQPSAAEETVSDNTAAAKKADDAEAEKTETDSLDGSEEEQADDADSEVTYFGQDADFSDMLHPRIGEPYEISAEEANAPEITGEILLHTEDERSAIKAYLRACIYNRYTSIDTSSLGMTFEELCDLTMEMYRNDPLLFFWEGAMSGRSNGITGICYVLYPYNYISAEEEAAIRRAGQIALSESITEDMTDRQKAMALHEWVAGNVTYDYDLKKRTVYDALVDRVSVCQGYADVYALLCAWAGLECGFESGGNHMWNRVKIDGKWYCVDCTWDENIKTTPSGIPKEYLLKSDAYICGVGGHTYSGERLCTDTSYDGDGVFWTDLSTLSDCGVFYFNSKGCYRLRWVDRYTCNLVFFDESSGKETLVRSFPLKNKSSYTISSSRAYYAPINIGVSLDRMGKYLYINDDYHVYRFDPAANTWATIYTETRSGRILFGLDVYKNQLHAYYSEGYYEEGDFVIPLSEADIYSGDTSAADTSALASYNLASPGVTSFVKRLYTVCLGRNYDKDGLNYWVEKLNTGQIDASGAASGFFFGDEFKNKNLSDSDFVDVMYKTMMGRSADEGGKAYWMKMLSYGVTREYVYKGFTESAEFTQLCEDYGVLRGTYSCGSYRDKNAGATGFIARLYTAMLGRSYDADGLEYWCRAYMSGEQSIETVATNGFLHSEELTNMHLSDKEYVVRMYKTFLDREPDEAGLKYWMEELASGRKNRDTLVYGFTLSQEFADIKKSFGLQ